MPRYRLTIAYDGTDYCGWQKQEPPDPNAPPPERGEGEEPPERPRIILPTVQHVVEQAVRDAIREGVTVMGASRTDSGVHAAGQVAAFTAGDDRARGWPLERGTEPLRRAINSRLPRDVTILDARSVPDTFDPVHDVDRKGYSYRLHVARDAPLWDRRYVHHVWSDLDIDAMNAAAALLVGEHDFAGYASAGHGQLSTVRTVFECRVVEETLPLQAIAPPGAAPSASPAARRYRIDVVGSGFLWNMVRIIGGTLVDIGLGRSDIDRARRALETGDRNFAGPTLPARGLRLEWIRYRSDNALPTPSAT